MHTMSLCRRCRLAVPAIALVVMSGCGGPSDDQPATPAAEPAGGAITLWTDSTELFMEHPALIVGAPDKFAVHLTDRTDFSALQSGRITLRFIPRGGGEPLVVVQETPRAPGIYGPSPAFTRAGVYDLSILVDSPQAKDSIYVPGLTVYATLGDAPLEEEGGEDGIPFLKEQQWKTPGFSMAPAVTGSVSASISGSGTLGAAAGRYAEITAPISGLVDASAVSSSPLPGQRVRRGQVVALLVPALGEGGSAYATARAELAEAEDEFARATRLLAAEAVPERRVHEARIRLTAARETLAGMSGGALVNGRLAVRSPIDGVVAARTIVPGARVEAGAPLFTIVDPSVVWLTARLPADAAMQLGRATTASFRIDGSERTYEAARAISVGSIIDSISRSVPVIYEVRNADGSIRIGSTARVDVRTGTRETGVLIPASAVLDEDGQPVAYVQLHGEAFEKRAITVGGTENGMTLVRTGVRAGEYVVNGAAYQVRLASLSTAVPTHGHEH